jgi:hypothetical protein
MAITPFFLMVCEKYIEDKEGRGSYIGEIGNIAAETLPTKLSGVSIVVGFAADAGDEYRLTLHGPHGRKFGVLASDVAAEANKDHPLVVPLRKLRLDVTSMEFNKEGIYELRFWDMSKKRVVLRRQFAVVRQERRE